MSRLTRSAVLVSAFAALGTISYLAYGHTTIFEIAIITWVVFFVVAGTRLEPAATGVVLFSAYVTPAAFVLAIGRHASAFATIWMGALLAIILRTSWRSPWNIPARWRWPLILVAVSIACSWPVVGYRELDFSLANAWNPRLPVTGVKISGIAAMGGVAFAALIHLTGLLWFDWLWARFGADRRAFVKHAVTPLAAALVLSCVVGVYQGFVNVAFLSGHIWPSMQRAAGTLMDANVFGMLAALWGPAFVVLAFRSRGRASRIVALAALSLSWSGVWLSGSRTAMLTAVIGLTLGVASLRTLVPPTAHSRRWAIGAVIGVGLFAIALASVPRQTASAFERARYLVPGFSLDSVKTTARELWVRDGYGTVAVSMIREFPWLGVGVGCYPMLVHDFGTETGLTIPPDNAQNWFRHQVAELGVVGSLGWMIWSVVLLRALWPRPLNPAEPGTGLRGPILAFGLASLVGMPGHEAAVVLTFWLFVFWYGTAEGLSAGTQQPISRTAGTALCLVAVGYATASAIPNALRPPFRAARFDFPYSYGADFEHPTQVWTAKHAVTVQQASDEWLKLTVWVNHPDADKRPVHVDVWKDQDHVINQQVRLGDRVTRFVRVTRGKRFVIETEADRTFRPAAGGTSRDNRDLGLAMQWEFVPNRPD
jgi:hypothetical protein